MSEAGLEYPETTSGLQKPLSRWSPGQSGNPHGRPKGSRNKLGEDFIRDLHSAWETNGIAVIEKVIQDKPAEFLKVVASLLPKHVTLDVSPMEDLADGELADVLEILRALRAKQIEGKAE